VEACKVAGNGGLGKEAIGIIGELYGIEGDLREAVRSGRIDADTLSSLLEIAKIQSAGASNRIEGIYAADKRLRELVKEKIPLPETEASRKSPAKACFYFPLCR
jgi:hypothetical protein